MSRLGDMIKKERAQRGIGSKQAARACGIAENYLLDVESGKRIIGDTEAARILRKLGASEEPAEAMEASWLDDDAPQTQKPAAPKVAVVKKEQPSELADAWLDALGGVMRRVPILDVNGKTVGHKPLPVMGGKIEGASAEKVFYYSMPDDALAGYRLLKGDLLFCIPVQGTPEDATAVIVMEGKTLARRVRKLEGNRLLLQTLNREPSSQTVNLRDVSILGRAIRADIALS